jgi:hypothetical protein
MKTLLDPYNDGILDIRHSNTYLEALNAHKTVIVKVLLSSLHYFAEQWIKCLMAEAAIA